MPACGRAYNSNLRVNVDMLPKMGTTTVHCALPDLRLQTYHDFDIDIQYPLLM